MQNVNNYTKANELIKQAGNKAVAPVDIVGIMMFRGFHRVYTLIIDNYNGNDRRRNDTIRKRIELM